MKWLVLLFFGGIGFLMLITGGIWGAKRYLLHDNGVRTEGKIVEILRISGSSVGSRRSGSYYPIVEFLTQDGEKFHFRGSTGNVHDYEVGKRVKVIYHPRDPSQAMISDFNQFWLGPILLMLGSSIALFLGVGGYNFIRDGDRSFVWAGSQARQAALSSTNTLRVAGVVTEARPVDGGKYVLVVKARRPGSERDDEFLSDALNFEPGSDVIGRPVEVDLDMQGPGTYSLQLRSLLRDIVTNSRTRRE